MEYRYIDENKIPDNTKDLFRILDVEGKLIDSQFKTTLKKQELIEAYKTMVLSRQQDTYMSQLQRQGRMLTFAPNFGEEALQVASAMVLEKDDWFVPAFRSNAAMLYRGVPLVNQFLYWNGNEQGSKYPEGVNVLPINIPIATQFSHAAGIAYGMKLANKKNVALSFIGDGGTAEGEFYEALNAASIHKWPVVFCINNNQWAISTPTTLESGSKTLAIKALAAGIPGVIVDGNDFLASYHVLKEAVHYARSGKGPILVELITWRQGPHTTSDNPRIYRSLEMEKERERWEPFHRLENYLIDHKIIKKSDIETFRTEALAKVKAAYQASTKINDPTIDEVFDFTYEKMPTELAHQKAIATKYYQEGGE